MRRKSIILLVILSLALYLSLQVSCSSGDEKTKDVTQGDVTVGDVINLEDTKTEDSAGDTSLSDAGEETMPDAVSIDATPDAEDDGGAVKDEGSTTDVGTASFIYWEEGPNTLDTHAEGIAAYADGKIYLMAIFGSSQYKREVYNIAEKKWEPLANPPEGFNNDMSMRAGGVIGKNIHIVNGHYWFTPYTDHYVLNTETLEWSKKEAYPGEPVGKSCAAVYEGKLYVAGGEKQINSNTSVNKFYRYDPAAGKWEELAPMKNARSDFACAFVNGKFHVAGGYAEYKVPLSSHEIYDPSTDTWTDAEPMPVAAFEIGNAGIEFFEKFVVIGGRDSSGSLLNKVQAYDQANNTWTLYDPIKYPRASHSVTTAEGKIYVIGGIGSNLYTSSVEIGNPKMEK